MRLKKSVCYWALVVAAAFTAWVILFALYYFLLFSIMAAYYCNVLMEAEERERRWILLFSGALFSAFVLIGYCYLV